MSGQHCTLTVEGNELVVRDLGSSNGTFVDSAAPPATHDTSSARIRGDTRVALSERHVLRVAGNVFLLEPDAKRFDDGKTLDLVQHDAVLDPILGIAIAGPQVLSAWATAAIAAHRQETLLVRGETGTGKERVARRYWAHGPRARGPFVIANSANIERNLADDAFFGHARGAFTGAVGEHVGFFEEARGGVLFLDEIGELPLEVQAKILRVVETGVFRTVGGAERTTDALVVCATNRNLEYEVAAGRFRGDLLERIMARHVELPPLRERPEEIPFLASLFATQYEIASPLSAIFVAALLRQPWSRNIRMFERVIAITATEGLLTEGHFGLDLARLSELAGRVSPAVEAAALPSVAPRNETPAVTSLDDSERALIEAALAATGFNVKATAERLGVSRSALYDKCKRLGIALRDR